MIDIKDKVLLLIAYLVFGFIIAIINIYKIKKDKKLSTIILVNAYYLIIFVITPICVLLKNGEIPYYIYTNKQKYYYLVLVNAVIGYAFLNIGYNIKIENEGNNTRTKNLILSGYIILSIGWIALFLWTKAYGSLTGIFRYASLIRSGYVIIYNKYTFVKPFCPMLIFAFVIFYSKLLELKAYNANKKILIVVGLLISAIGSYIYIIANDGRMFILIVLLTIIIPYIEKKSKKMDFKKIIIYFFIGIMIMIILGQLDNITYYLRNKQKRQKKVDNDVITIVANELGYTYSNNININYFRDEEIVENYTIFKDIKNIVLAWIPQSLKPEDAINLFDYNTSFYKDATGQLPTDLITASIYKFGNVGVVILPLFVGIVFKILEKKLFQKRNESTYYLTVGCLTIMYLGLRFMAYYDLSQILFGSFYIIISMIIVKIISKIQISKIIK